MPDGKLRDRLDRLESALATTLKKLDDVARRQDEHWTEERAKAEAALSEDVKKLRAELAALKGPATRDETQTEDDDQGPLDYFLFGGRRARKGDDPGGAGDGNPR